MVQLYFLSILCNGAIGFLFIFGNFGENKTIEGSMKISPLSDGFRLILGIVTGVVGILKLLSPMRDEAGRGGIFLLGDLLPALAGIAAGFMLVYGFYREHSAKVDTEGTLDRLGEIVFHNKKIAGVVLLAISVLHFLFPAALFL